MVISLRTYQVLHAEKGTKHEKSGGTERVNRPNSPGGGGDLSSNKQIKSGRKERLKMINSRAWRRSFSEHANTKNTPYVRIIRRNSSSSTEERKEDRRNANNYTPVAIL